MGTIKEEAAGYESTASIHNISELSSVDTDLVVFDEKESEYPYKYIELEGKRYKMPLTVLASLKAVLEENPNLKKFKVKKTGEGRDTKYTVIPLS